MNAKFLHHQPVSNPGKKRARGFTRIELGAVIAATTLLGVVALPLLGTTSADSERMICFNNLRLVGRGIQIWAADHNQQLPWWTPVADDGELGPLRPGAAWIEYAFLSNDLATPKILACPSDSGAKRAREWYEFISSSFRGNAVSYSLGLHASTDNPQSWVSADRNFRAQPGGNCPANVNNVFTIAGTPGVPTSFTTAWTNAVHGEFGHVLTTRGSVEFTSTPRLEGFMARTSDNGTIHILRAR